MIIHSQFTFRCCHYPSVHTGKIKNPAYVPVSRVKNPWSGSFTCLPPLHPSYIRDLALDTPWIGRDGSSNPGSSDYGVLLSQPTSSASSWLICSCRVSFTSLITTATLRIIQLISSSSIYS